ncbi:MAG: hypothetical protein ACI9C4_001314 [Paraglaciecola sp.]|jgi:hypothetical protein
MRVLLLGLPSVFNHWRASEPFTDGPLMFGFGKHAPVQQYLPLDKEMQFNVVFDVCSTGSPKTLNKGFDTLVRFLTMDVANGIPPEHIQLALVIHAKASIDVLNDVAHQKNTGQATPIMTCYKPCLKTRYASCFVASLPPITRCTM